MKGGRKQYPKMEQLPPTAQSVRNYADSKGITVAYVYKQYAQGKLEIVDFQGYNFVLINN